MPAALMGLGQSLMMQNAAVAAAGMVLQAEATQISTAATAGGAAAQAGKL